MSRKELKQHDFHGLGIAPGLLKRIKALGFVHPTPIQFKAIPIATSGEDVVGIAQTGSGKTLAFSIPMLQHVSATKKIGLVLLPTRELAVQVEETLKKLAGQAGLRTALVIGGMNPQPQIKQLKAKPHIIVATPGRLIDHIEQKHVSLSNVGILILDEADRMLDMGFEPQLKRILSFVPHDRQTMLFSATMPEEIAAIARQYMKKPLRIEVARPGTTAEKIDQEVFIVPRAEKMDLLQRVLQEYRGSVLVFSRTKHGAKKIARKIRQMGHTADEIHSNRSQNQRQKALKGFASGKYRVLVATDIAARGIDVEDIELVVNYDLPNQIEDYVHRIGRTGRAGRSGKAISFASPEQKKDIKQIEKLINITLPIKSHTSETLESIKKTSSVDRTRNKTSPNRPRGRNRNRKRSQRRRK
ncbi:DEAD/DEAH box helicase [Patescibacteria group bacterium]|nr:DEAD/DEAH box helicase [Patescibacteria group bacterium]